MALNLRFHFAFYRVSPEQHRAGLHTQRMYQCDMLRRVTDFFNEFLIFTHSITTPVFYHYTTLVSSGGGGCGVRSVAGGVAVAGTGAAALRTD